MWTSFEGGFRCWKYRLRGVLDGAELHAYVVCVVADDVRDVGSRLDQNLRHVQSQEWRILSNRPRSVKCGRVRMSVGVRTCPCG